MRILLDENLPKKLKIDYPDHEVFTVRDKGWNGIKNGELLKRILADEIRVLLTVDKNMRYQQNFDKYPVTVLVFDTFDNSYDSLTQFTNQIKAILDRELLPTGVTIVELS